MFDEFHQIISDLRTRRDVEKVEDQDPGILEKENEEKCKVNFNTVGERSYTLYSINMCGQKT